MVEESYSLPSIKDASELAQRSEFCRMWLKTTTEDFSEWYCDGRSLHVSHEFDKEIEVFDLTMDLKYYDTYPPCIEDWAEAIATRLVEESTIEFDKDERELLQTSVATMLVSQPEVVRRLIGTAIIEEGYFESL